MDKKMSLKNGDFFAITRDDPNRYSLSHIWIIKKCKRTDLQDVNGSIAVQIKQREL